MRGSSLGTEMVKDKDIPYLSIVGHMLAAVSGDQEEYFWSVDLIFYDRYQVWG